MVCIRHVDNLHQVIRVVDSTLGHLAHLLGDGDSNLQTPTTAALDSRSLRTSSYLKVVARARNEWRARFSCFSYGFAIVMSSVTGLWYAAWCAAGSRCARGSHTIVLQHTLRIRLYFISYLKFVAVFGYCLPVYVES